MAHTRYSRAALAALAALALTITVGTPGARAVGEIPSVTTLDEITPTPNYAFESTTFKASINFPEGTTCSPCPNGTLKIKETTSGTSVLVATAVFPGDTQPVYVTVPGGFDVGTHTFTATYVSDNPDTYLNSTSAPRDYTVDVAPSETSIDGPSKVETHHTFVLNALVVVPATAGYGSGATVSFWRQGDGAPICTVDAVLEGAMSCVVPSQPVGTATFYAVYSGNAYATGSTSDAINVSIVADVVHASGVGVSWATIYPVRDGYKDTDAVKGTRNEPISVSIRIYNGSGNVVASSSITSGSGTYSYSWNGRNSSGKILPEGTYRVVQTLRDGAGTTKKVTDYVNLSKKFLHWHGSSVVKKGSGIAAYGQIGDGSVAVDTTNGVLRLKAPTPQYDWAGAGWQFSLPSAVKYKAVSVGVYAKHVEGLMPVRVGAQDFSECAYSSTTSWYETCFDTWHKVGNSSGSLNWFSTDTLTLDHVSGTKVRAMVSAYAGTTFVYKARVTFKYATLGY